MYIRKKCICTRRRSPEGCPDMQTIFVEIAMLDRQNLDTQNNVLTQFFVEAYVEAYHDCRCSGSE